MDTQERNRRAYEPSGRAAAYNECPSFKGCGCNQCPLDVHMQERWVLEGEDECRAERPTRLKIAAKYPDLPTGGLTLAEIARDARRAKAKARFAAMPAEHRAQVLARLATAAKRPAPCPV